MAKRRVLKKDVDFLVSEVVSDCYTFMMFNGDKSHDEAIKVIESALDKRNEAYKKISSRVKHENPKEVKKYYKQIQQEFLEGVDECFTKLSELTKK
ncbi:MAG: hypothetical protein H6537_10115 [Bacteroidales bacterium]|nr:hypothetical protein [Bacteroidales bacterium]HPD96101.1 hypothetical protein [Tenuifilaceae bacterium]HRX31396.1 hypothetical protein [Tenuifilaceae bacterium]